MVVIGVIYASTLGKQELNGLAIERLLTQVEMNPAPRVLWTLQYQQHSPASPPAAENADESNVITLSSTSLDLVFDEGILGEVESAWKKVIGDEEGSFLVFEDRNGVGDEDDGEDE
jgi:hypothetical protein